MLFLDIAYVIKRNLNNTSLGVNSLLTQDLIALKKPDSLYREILISAEINPDLIIVDIKRVIETIRGSETDRTNSTLIKDIIRLYRDARLQYPHAFIVPASIISKRASAARAGTAITRTSALILPGLTDIIAADARNWVMLAKIIGLRTAIIPSAWIAIITRIRTRIERIRIHILESADIPDLE